VCPLFRGNPTYREAGCIFIFPDTAQVTVGTECRLVAEYTLCDRICFVEPWHCCLTDFVMTPCLIDTLGCGVLTECDDEYHCLAFYPLNPSTDAVQVDDLGGFVVGDTVYAYGVRVDMGTFCSCPPGALLHPTYVACPDTLSPVRKVTFGQIKGLFRR
jgi:hypothetical protein